MIEEERNRIMDYIITEAAPKEAEEILKAGKDRDGIFYSVYTWACLMYFVSGLWR